MTHIFDDFDSKVQPEELDPRISFEDLEDDNWIEEDYHDDYADYDGDDWEAEEDF